MGRPKIKMIDDSQPEVEEKKKPIKAAKSESVETRSEVEPTSEVNEASQEQGAQQTQSEPGDASDVSRPDEQTSEKKAEKKSTKPGKAKPRSKKYQELVKELDRTKTYPLAEAVDMVKKLSYTKFNATIEAHINTTALGIRGLVSLPFASGKKLRILVFGKGAETSGADIFGSDEVIEEISKGKVDFDLVITTPEWMLKLARIARILGPRGLMPNPKNGTITEDLKKAVEGFQAGKTEYKTEAKAPVIHLALGKLDQPTEELSANIKILLQTVGKTKVRKVSLSPTMGPSVKLDLTNI